MKLDDFDLLALGFFVPRVLEGEQALRTYLRDHGVIRPTEFTHAWLAAAEKTGLLARDPQERRGIKYSLTNRGFVLYHTNLAARQRKQRSRRELEHA